MIYWYVVLLATSVLTLVQYEKYIVKLKTPQTSARLGRRQGTSVLGWALEIVQSYDPDAFVGSVASKITYEYDFGEGIFAFALTTTPRGMEELTRHPNVAHCGIDREIAPHSPTPWIWNSQSEPPRYLWHLDRINKEELNYDGKYPVIGNQGKDVTVYLMDGGLDRTHPEFEDRTLDGFSFLDGDIKKITNLNSDLTGHGTLCAGIIAGKSVGIAPKAKVMLMQVLNRKDRGNLSDLIEALRYVKMNAVAGKSVVSISLGSKCIDPRTKALVLCDEPVMRYAVDILVRKGIPIVAAAGNDNISTCYASPASEPSVFTVGSTNVMDVRVPDSNHGDCLTMFAPGWLIQSTYLHRRYAARTGTSMAAPLVAGVFAALLSTYDYPSTEALYKQVIGWSWKSRVTGIPYKSLTRDRLLYVPF